MRQSVFIDHRPVILSKHKRDVIAHGRPLGPIGSLRSISPYVPSVYNNKETKHGEALALKSPLSVPSTSLSEYQRAAQQNLIAINNNLSNMLQETCSGIDDICQKVRMCLMDANNVQSSVSECCTKTTMSGVDTRQRLDPCQEENNLETIDDIMEENEEEIEEVKTSEAATMKEDSIEPVAKPKKVASLTPFFTVLNPKAQSAESVGVKLIKSITSKMGLSQKCTTENFQKTMKEVEKLPDYEKFLINMVEDLNKEINECYSSCKKMGGDQGETLLSARKIKRPKSSPSEYPTRERKDDGEHSVAKPTEEIKTSFRKELIEDRFSDNDFVNRDDSVMTMRSCRNAFSICAGKMDFSYADVYRKRAITDLHQRMLAQLEANDSLIFFQKLMSKNRRHLQRNKSQQQTAENGQIKSSNLKTHLQYLLRDKKQKPTVADLSKMYQDSLWFKQKNKQTKRIKSETKNHAKQEKKVGKNMEKCIPKSYSVHSAISMSDKRHKKRTGKKISQESCSVSQTGSCKCKISVTNNLPLSEPEKCKMHWMRAKYSQLTHKKLKYLDILDDITKDDLIPLKAEYPRRDHLSKHFNVKNTYLYRLLSDNGKGNKSAWAQLFQSNKNKEHRLINAKTINSETVYNMDKSEVIKTLSKYIFAESDQTFEKQKNVFTVMPVHVIYDNARNGNSTRRSNVAPQKLPLQPMKETKEGVRKAEWIKDVKKPKPMKIVFDPLLKKIEKEIKMSSAKHENRLAPTKLAAHNSWSPKNFGKYCTPQRQSSTLKTSAKTDSGCQKTQVSTVTEIFKRSPNRCPVPPLWSPPSFDTISSEKDSQVRKRIQKDIEAQTAASRAKSDQERKIWENKYAKSAGQKLLNFIEKQPAAYQVPIPKYALPKPVAEPTKQQQMLDKLRTLKQKNNNIQTNIQKAIEVIEYKMMDILEKPSRTHSIEAFSEMEKEITNVLSMMKTPTSRERPLKIDKLHKLEEDAEYTDKISEELFKKLDKILESPSTSEKSSKNNLAKPVRKHGKKSPNFVPRSSDMNKICFSSTSASGEEKITVTAISPKRAKPQQKCFIRNRSPEGAAVEELANIHLELQKLRSELKEEESTDDIDQEREVVAADNVENCNIIPLQKQVVNLALLDPKNRSAGDQVNEQANQEDEPSYSFGDGDSSSLPNVSTNKIQSKTKCLLPKDNDTTPTTAPEISDPYYTPRTSPLTEHRGSEQFQPACSIIIESQENDSKPEENTSVKVSDDKSSSEQAKQKSLSESVLTSSLHKSDEIDENSNLIIIEDVNSESNETKSQSAMEREEFYKNVNRIITRAENVYNQLEEIEDELSTERVEKPVPKIVVFQDPPKIEEPESDTFLTPFMHAVKDMRKTGSEESPRKLCCTPSYFNVLTFLDNLADFKEEQTFEVFTARIWETAHLWHIPTVFHQLSIGHQIHFDTIADVPKKKSSCLKKSSSHLNVNKVTSKSKQKVSFLLRKEEKATQVAACPIHATSKVHSDVSTQFAKAESQESTYLDALDSKSIEKTSLIDEESTFQSTLEISDDISEKCEQHMSETLLQNQLKSDDNSKKNVVELFRNNGAEERKSETIKVFYDNYKKGEENLSSKLISGFYNENSILQIKQSMSKDLAIKKRDSLQKLDKEEILAQLLKESPLLEPLKNVNQFIDSKLLKEAIEHRQKIRTMRRNSVCAMMTKKKTLGNENTFEWEQEGFLKGIYVLVYLLMFTALNLDYKCVQ